MSFGIDTSKQSAKGISMEFGAWHLLAATPASKLQVFSAKILFPPTRESFLPRKFPTIRYLQYYLSLQERMMTPLSYKNDIIIRS